MYIPPKVKKIPTKEHFVTKTYKITPKVYKKAREVLRDKYNLTISEYLRDCLSNLVKESEKEQ